MGKLGDNWAVTGGGSRIGDTSDEFHYLYKEVTGNFKMIIESASIEPDWKSPYTAREEWSKMGIMARQTLKADSALRVRDPSHPRPRRCLLQYREIQSGSAPVDNDTGSIIPFSVHHGTIGLERIADEFTCFYVDSTGKEIQSDLVTIQMQEPIYIGIAVTSTSKGKTAMGLFSDVRLQIDGVDVSVSEWILHRCAIG